MTDEQGPPRQTMPRVHFKIAIVWALSGMVVGITIADTLHRHLPMAKAVAWSSGIAIVLGLAQVVLLTITGIELYREKKRLLADYDAMLDKLKASLLQEAPEDHEAIGAYIGKMRRSIPR